MARSICAAPCNCEPTCSSLICHTITKQNLRYVCVHRRMVSHYTQRRKPRKMDKNGFYPSSRIVNDHVTEYRFAGELMNAALPLRKNKKTKMAQEKTHENPRSNFYTFPDNFGKKSTFPGKKANFPRKNSFLSAKILTTFF